MGSTCEDTGFCTAVQIPERCNRTVPADLFDAPERYEDALLFGALYDSQEHLDSLWATTLAVEEVNEAGGLEGRDFAVVICDYNESLFDDGLDSLAASAEGATWLSQVAGVDAIVGPRGSSRTQAAFEAVAGRDVLVISPSATSPTLTGLDETSPTNDNPGLLWRTAPTDDIQAGVLVGDLATRGVSSVAVIAQRGAYGDALSQLVVSGYETAGDGTIEVFSYQDTPFAAVADVADGAFEEVVFISSDIQDYLDFFTAAVGNAELESTYASMGILLPDAAYNTALLDLDPGGADPAAILFGNVRGTRYKPASGSIFNTFAASFFTRYGEDPEESGFTVHSYDATWLIFYAMVWAHYNEGDLGGQALARGLRKISDANAETIAVRPDGWPSVLEAFEAGRTINLEGGSGRLDYDPATEETTAAVEIWGIADDGSGGYEFTAIETVE